MNISEKHRLTKAIKKAMAETNDHIKEKSPRVAGSFYYGAYDIAPQFLVIWYLFETNHDLAEATESGLTELITQNTVKVMIENGYPRQAFADTEFPASKISPAGGTKKQQESLWQKISHRKASVAFTTLQDIKEKANGDYRLYFQ